MPWRDGGSPAAAARPRAALTASTIEFTAVVVEAVGAGW